MVKEEGAGCILAVQEPLTVGAVSHVSRYWRRVALRAFVACEVRPGRPHSCLTDVVWCVSQIAPATMERIEGQRPIGILMFGDSVDSKLVSFFCWLAAGNVRSCPIGCDSCANTMGCARFCIFCCRIEEGHHVAHVPQGIAVTDTADDDVLGMCS